MELSKLHKEKSYYRMVLSTLEKAVVEGDVAALLKLSKAFDNARDKITSRRFFNVPNNPLENTNVVILACKNNKVNILECLFSNEANILNNLSVGLGKAPILPDDKDDVGHNAFYYAMRSCNTQLLDTLINKWPNNYFDVHSTELDNILSRSYEEFQLRNIPLLDEMVVFIETQIVNLRFFSKTPVDDKNVTSDVDDIIQRIDMVFKKVGLLKTEYSTNEVLDEKFLFMLKFVARNIHLLKRELKSTYNKLPWEEIEFCLVSFILSHTKEDHINMFYDATLTKEKLLNYLEIFARMLKSEKDVIETMNINKLAELPKQKREKVIEEIVSKCPEFEQLYEDYQQIRDICSLNKINYYVTLAISCDPKQREGQLLITRVLQVIGEYLKNTLESPKLSNTTSELLLLLLPKNTRKVVIDLRNSLSHAYSLFKRMEIEQNTDVNFFIGIQDDTKTIGNAIKEILYTKRIKMVKVLLERFVNSEDLEEIKEVCRIFTNVGIKDLSENFQMMKHGKLEKLVKELRDSIPDKTSYERELFRKIDNIFSTATNKSNDLEIDYVTSLGYLILVSHTLSNKIDDNIITGLKYTAHLILDNIFPRIEPSNLKEIVKLSYEILDSVSLRTPNFDLDNKMRNFIYEMLFLTEFGIVDIKWIGELREKLNKKRYFVADKQKKAEDVAKEKRTNQLARKLSELKIILNNHSLNDRFIEKFPAYKSNKQLQTVIEMLVLDIMSILGAGENLLENNVYFLDDYAPVLMGKCLRNHLAHNNDLVDILLSHPQIALILNAKGLIEMNIEKENKKIGKYVKDIPSKLEEKFEQDLMIVTNQQRMFVALEEGNLRSLKACLRNGADINATSINSWTALHFAAKGSNLEVIKFVLDQNLKPNVRDVNGKNPLHTAATYGRTNAVEFFIKEAKLRVDDIDNLGQTPLHHAAANGHEDTVKTLLKFNADADTRDKTGFAPLHQALRYNQINVIKILLDKDLSANINEVVGGFTLLHMAAECGYPEVVNLLLENKANVNATNDRQGTPLHAATIHGHLNGAHALILKGADVNARVLDGCTPLHYAVDHGQEELVNLLLEHGANVNAFDISYRNTPLHYAAKDGHTEIVRALLKKKADLNAATYETATPLHFAARSGHKDIVELLLEYGAKIDPRTNKNFTPLHTAVLTGHKDIADVLLKSGAIISSRNIKGETPLHLASMIGNVEIIELLITNKADVNIRDYRGDTPLQAAAFGRNEEAVALLIKNKADVNTTSTYGFTPLHKAIMGGNKSVVNLLLENGAQVNAGCTVVGSTSLHLAVEAGRKDVLEVLIANGADVNAKSKDNMTPLSCAVKYNRKEIVEVLLLNGVNKEVEGSDLLTIAVFAGYSDTLEVLLKNKVSVNTRLAGDLTPLHLAAIKGNKLITNILLRRGADINAVCMDETTPLYRAVMGGFEEIVEIFIEKGANVNVRSKEGYTPLNAAATCGHKNIVKLLLKQGASVSIKDNTNRTALEMAVAHGRLEVVKILLQHKKGDMNGKGNDDWTILHIASQGNNLDLVKYLVEEGSDINARNASGSKPVHIAAREGFKEAVEFFLSKGMDINEPGGTNQTLLHYAAMKGHLEVAKYLLSKGADVNAKDDTGLTPLHMAAHFNYKNIIEVLLECGAIYEARDNLSRKPLKFAKDNVIDLFMSTEKLFDAVKRNNCPDAESYIRAGAFLNAKNADSSTPLHYAAWKGFDAIVNLLLQNKADPNVVGKKKFTPLHYAVKFSHFKIVKDLLSNGAVHDPLSDSGKTPLELSVSTTITDLLKLVNTSFRNVKNGNVKVINDLNKIKDSDTVKVVMKACNRENQTLVVAAMLSNFPYTDKLKEVLQGHIATEINEAMMLLCQDKYQDGLDILKRAYKKRIAILGPDNPGSLDIQLNIAQALFKQGVYHETLKLHEEVYRKQKKLLGLNNENTLSTRSVIAFILHRQGKDKEALDIFQEVYKKQEDILGSNHRDTLTTLLHMALVLNRLEKYEEALSANKEVFNRNKYKLGAYDPATISAQNNIAMVLVNQDKYEEALKMYREVYEKKKLVLGANHSETLRTLHNIAGVLMKQEKLTEALKSFQEVLAIQQKVLGPNNPDTLNTQHNLANVLLAQSKSVAALKIYKDCYERRLAVFGPIHFSVLDILNKIELINRNFRVQGSNVGQVLEHLQKEINVAASTGDVLSIQHFLKVGIDVNDKDIEGRTPLHFAISNGHVGIVKILIKNGADVTQATNKGNTPLHTATSKGYKEIIDILLQQVTGVKLKDFVNARTISGGTTALHVAAKGGLVDVVTCLLKHGAIYNIENKEGQTPVDLALNQNVVSLLEVIEELFEDAKIGTLRLITKLKELTSNKFLAVANAQNNERDTLLRVVIMNKHKTVAQKLLEMLKAKC